MKSSLNWMVAKHTVETVTSTAPSLGSFSTQISNVGQNTYVLVCGDNNKRFVYLFFTGMCRKLLIDLPSNKISYPKVLVSV